MADFTYKTVTVTNAATLAEAKQQAATVYLSQFGEPTQQEIDALLAEIEAEGVERVDLAGLEADITGELEWIADTLANFDAMTATQKANLIRRILQEQQRELRAWRYVVRRLS